MPYKSERQRAYFNANREKLAKQGVNVDEWNAASEGMKLPERAAKPKTKMHPAVSRRDLVKIWKGKR